MQYVADYNGRLPKVTIDGTPETIGNIYGWVDSLYPYSRTQKIFQCPVEPHDSAKSPRERNYTDYWYNRRLDNQPIERLSHPEHLFLTGDGNDGRDATDACYSLNNLPDAWRNDKSSPAYRHIDGANYAFVDGHVKWLKPVDVTGAKPTGSNFTFAIK